ncbi:MAG: hypothetical protein LUG51_14340 [Tannerellaceae bacterium]|nr:hypothetical protein [Tannerellaceae bacterium]
MLEQIKLQNVRFSLSGQNLLTWTHYSGFDPEVTSSDNTMTQGTDYGVYPVARSVNVGVHITF